MISRRSSCRRPPIAARPPATAPCTRPKSHSRRWSGREMSGNFDNNQLVAAFEQVPRLLAADANLIRRGRFFDARFQVGIGAVPFDVIVAAGKITSLERGPFLMRPW